MVTKSQIAIFAMGCFWSPQVIFDSVDGVKNTVVGYTGGDKKYKNLSYEEVCSGKTGHAESIKIEFDPKIVSYEKLLDIFFMNHNPLTKNQQGPDIGSQYRSEIFYLNIQQKELAMKSKDKYQKKINREIVTEISKAKNFYPAEDYHQKYYKKHKVLCKINNLFLKK